MHHAPITKSREPSTRLTSTPRCVRGAVDVASATFHFSYPIQFIVSSPVGNPPTACS